jgi:Zn-dependent protease
MPGSLRIARIAGIDIEANVSWLLVLVLLTWSLAVDRFPAMVAGQPAGTYWVLGLIAALLFASVLVHERAHSLVDKARGLLVKSIMWSAVPVACAAVDLCALGAQLVAVADNTMRPAQISLWLHHTAPECT